MDTLRRLFSTTSPSNAPVGDALVNLMPQAALAIASSSDGSGTWFYTTPSSLAASDGTTVPAASIPSNTVFAAGTISADADAANNVPAEVVGGAFGTTSFYFLGTTTKASDGVVTATQGPYSIYSHGSASATNAQSNYYYFAPSSAIKELGGMSILTVNTAPNQTPSIFDVHKATGGESGEVYISLNGKFLAPLAVTATLTGAASKASGASHVLALSDTPTTAFLRVATGDGLSMWSFRDAASTYYPDLACHDVISGAPTPTSCPLTLAKRVYDLNGDGFITPYDMTLRNMAVRGMSINGALNGWSGYACESKAGASSAYCAALLARASGSGAFITKSGTGHEQVTTYKDAGGQTRSGIVSAYKTAAKAADATSAAETAYSALAKGDPRCWWGPAAATDPALLKASDAQIVHYMNMLRRGKAFPATCPSAPIKLCDAGVKQTSFAAAGATVSSSPCVAPPASNGSGGKGGDGGGGKGGTAPSSAPSSLQSFLTKKEHGVPVWGIILAGVVLLALLFTVFQPRKRRHKRWR